MQKNFFLKVLTLLRFTAIQEPHFVPEEAALAGMSWMSWGISRQLTAFLGVNMSRLFTVRLPLMAAAFLCAFLLAFSECQAIDFKVSGQWVVGFEYSNVMPRHNRHSANDYFGALQRFRVQLDAVASESLSGSVQVELGRIDWGKASTGGALGADGKIAKVRFAYLDWIVPETAIKVRMGLQTILLPGYLSQWGFGPIFGKEMAGITVHSPLYNSDNFNVDMTLFWARPYNDNAEEDKYRYIDNMDNFGLVLPFSGPNYKIQPYFMYSMIGKYSMTNVSAAQGDSGIVAPRGGLMPVLGGNHTYTWFADRYLHGLNKPYGDGIWAGLAGSVDILGDWRVAFEGAFGSVDMGTARHYKGFGDAKGRNFDVRREGWYAGAKVEYKLDWGVPGFLFWYGSGDDDNPYNGSERLPQYNTPWGVTSLGYGGGTFDEFTWKVLGHNPGGTIGMIAQIDKLSFINDLSHVLRFGYYIGTNSPKMPRKARMDYPTRADGPNAYLTTTDTAWELNLVTSYKIYENLTVNLDAAYVRLNLDDDTWRGKQDAHWKDNYRIGLAFAYNF